MTEIFISDQRLLDVYISGEYNSRCTHKYEYILRYTLSLKIKDWLRENVIWNKWHCNHPLVSDADGVILVFDNVTDGVAFKLRWM